MNLFFNFFLVVSLSIAGLKEKWDSIQQHRHYGNIRRTIMENTKEHLGHERTPKQQMDALVQLLYFDASKIDPHLNYEFSFQWTKEGGKVFPKERAGWGDQEYSFHQDLRDIIRGRDGNGKFKTYQDGLKASLAKAFDDLITSNDANAFHKFFQKFADELMICMDAVDRGINLAIETTLGLGIYRWYPDDSIEVNLNRFMNDVIRYQICQNCNTLKCKNDSWDSVKTKVDFWRPAIELSGGKATEQKVKQYIDDYLKDYDELADQFKCPFENGNGRNHNPHYGRRQAPYKPYYGRQEPQNPYSPQAPRDPRRQNVDDSASNFGIIAALLSSALMLL